MILKQNEFSLESDPKYHSLPHLQSIRIGNKKYNLRFTLLQLNFEIILHVTCHDPNSRNKNEWVLFDSYLNLTMKFDNYLASNQAASIA